MSGRFGGKVAIVTGGSSGIGAAIVARLAGEGASVLVADLDPPAQVDERILFQRTDVASAEACVAAIAGAIDRFGRLVSDEASFMTGSIMIADGGTRAHIGQPNVPAQLRRRAATPADA